MKKEFKLGEIPIISEELNKITQKELPFKTIYKINKIHSKIKAEVDIFNEVRQKIVNKYAERDENGEIKTIDNNQVKIQPNLEKEFLKEMNEFLYSKTEVEFSPLKLDDFKDDMKLTGIQMEALDFFIEDEE